MIVTFTQEATKESNTWKQDAEIKVTVRCAADTTTDARVEAAIKALDEAHRKMKRELRRFATGKSS